MGEPGSRLIVPRPLETLLGCLPCLMLELEVAKMPTVFPIPRQTSHLACPEAVGALPYLQRVHIKQRRDLRLSVPLVFQG